MTLEQASAVWDYIKRELVWFAGLVAAVSTALVGQAHLWGDRWEHIITTAGIVASVIVAYNIRSFAASKAKQDLSETQIRDLSALVRAAREKQAKEQL